VSATTTITKITITITTSSSLPVVVAALTPTDLGLEALFHHVHDPMLVIDAHSQRVALSNAAADELFGFGDAAVAGHPVEELLPEPLRTRCRERLAAFANGWRWRVLERTAPVVMFGQRPDGQPVPVEVRFSRVEEHESFIVAILHRAREREAEQQLRDLEAMYRIDEPLYRSLRLEEILQALVDVAADMLRVAKTSVLVWDASHEILSARATHGFRAETVPLMRYRPGQGISTRVAASGEPIAVEDLRTDPRIPPEIAAINATEGIRSLVSVPIKLGGEVFGVFNVNSTTPRVFSEHELRLLSALAQRAALAIDNSRLFAESEQRRRETEALYYADAVLYRSLQLDDVLRALVEVVTDILGADKAQVLVWDARHEHLVVGAYRGYMPETVAQLAFRPGEGIAGRVAATGETLMVEDAVSDPRTAPRINAITAGEGVRSYICVPIIVGGAVFGVFSVVYNEPRTFSDDDKRPLEALAQRAAVAVQNAELYERVERAAALEERSRLARELHDAVTQTLFSASLIADVLPRLWERDPSQGRARLEELRRLNRGALAEMRALLLELRPLAMSETPMNELLRQLVEATMSRTTMQISFSISGTPRELSAEVQVGLYRLAQEALNNVVRHSKATSASVTLEWHSDRLTLTIADDGCGFSPSAVPPGHLGLTFMRERAAALGASLRLETARSQGTTIAIDYGDAAATLG